MNRRRPDVFIWVCRLKGTIRQTSAFIDRDDARSWVEKQLGDGGTWNEAENKSRYDQGPDTGIVVLVPVIGAAGIAIHSQTVEER